MEKILDQKLDNLAFRVIKLTKMLRAFKNEKITEQELSEYLEVQNNLSIIRLKGASSETQRQSSTQKHSH